MKASVVLLMTLLYISNVAAGAGILSPEMDQLRKDGFNALFNMDYPSARKSFEDMKAIDPQHPAGYIYLANAIWLGHMATLRRLQSQVFNRDNSFFSETDDPTDPDVDKEFNKAITRGISMAQNRLQANKNDTVGLYYLGMGRTLIAGYEGTIKRSFFSALRNASKGVGLHKTLLALDPHCVDANLSIGTFDYVVGSLPLAVKILIFFGGVHGSKSDGLRRLELVARDGNYARDEAAVILMVLYEREKKVEKSLELIQEKTKQYPRNYFFQLQLGSDLVELGRYKESFAVYDRMLNDPGAMNYMSDLIHYQYGDALLQLRAWKRAREHYLAAIESTHATEGLVTMARLGSARCLDALGERTEAIVEYNQVLKRKNIFDSHKSAEAQLKNPYQ